MVLERKILKIKPATLVITEKNVIKATVLNRDFIKTPLFILFFDFILYAIFKRSSFFKLRKITIRYETKKSFAL